MPFFPVKIEIDLPGPLVHRQDKGYSYSHRFTGPDRDYQMTDVWRDPARGTVMLLPWQFDPDFKTTNTGLLRRLLLEDWVNDGGSVSTNWEASAAFGVPTDTFLFAKTIGERLTTVKKWPYNQGFFLRTYAYGGYGGRATMLELEWGLPDLETSPQYKMILRFDGSFDLEKYDPVTNTRPVVFTGYITPETKDRQNLQQRYFELMILPYRRNEILIWSSLGAYPVWEDTTRDGEGQLWIDPLIPNAGEYRGNEDDGAPHEGYGDAGDKEWVITEYGQFGIKYPSSKGYFQLTPVSFKCSGAGNGFISPSVAPTLPYKPNSANYLSGRVLTKTVDKDQTFSLTNITGTLAQITSGLDEDGNDDILDWNLVLHGERPDSTGFPTQAIRTPMVYGFDIVVPPGAQETVEDPTAITNYIRKLTRSYTEEGSSCELEFKDPRSISETYMQALHRYCRIFWVDGIGQENELFYGIATEPEFDQWPVLPHDIDPTDIDHTPVAFTVKDPWWDFENTQLTNVRALDGLKVSDAVKEILRLMGWPEDRWDIDDLPTLLPKDETAPEKLILSEQVASAKDLLFHLRDDFTTAENPPYKWRMDFAPVLKSGVYKICFRFKDPDKAADVVAHGQTRTLYGTAAAAFTAGAGKGEWIRTFRRKVLEPEANYVEIWGADPNGTPILKIKEDTASQDPTTAFALRPLNWIGRRREVVYINTSFNTPEHVTRAANAYYNRLVLPRITAEATAEHRDDDVLGMIMKIASDNNRRYFVTEFQVEHILEHPDLTVRNATYTLEARA